MSRWKISAAVLFVATTISCLENEPTQPGPLAAPALQVAQGFEASPIAFVTNRDANPEIYVMNADGSSPQRLTRHLASDWDPAWSPDGRQIAFATFRDGNREIYVMSADGSNPENLTAHWAEDWEPTWSPDGRQIAFTRWHTGKPEIYVMSADGSNPENLTAHPASDLGPAWSPDGRQIAFSTTRDGNREIYVMNADGSNPERLTAHPALDWKPTWSTDGRQIAFVTHRDGNAEIYVMNADGSNPENLTANPAWDTEPTWSPDGGQIAFATTRDGNPPCSSFPWCSGVEIYVMSKDGSDPARLTENPASDWGPAWTIYAATRQVDIDIKPGSYPNCFNNDGHGVIPVAILGAADFDVIQIDPATVQLEGLAVGARGKSNGPMAHVEDINSDGFDDLVVQIEDVDGTFTSGDGVASLTGQLFDGTAIEGSDDICVVP